ncbi:thymidine kinase [Cardinium endosymbiont of Nabis limbatus]|uniref:thymidine kinase n=1 Tax=Cardinium endosymbiont of Nabis limbatus TaxID=3066217 RepID=UPI003AF382AC
MSKLYFYYAAMNAGKSTILLQASYNYKERGMETLLFSPLIDTRYKRGVIFSRIGLEAVSKPFSAEDNLFYFVKERLQETNNLKCILVDEAQFLTKAQVLQLSDVVDECNIPVLAYGLRSDFRGEPFEGSLYLLVWADKIDEIKTICYCGAKAIMNMRIDDRHRKVTEGEQIEIGGNERYIAVCRKHFKLGEAGGCV